MDTPRRLVLLGDPVSQSLSPQLHNAALRKAGLGVQYETLRCSREELPATLRMLRSERAAGNVTVPHKKTFAESCDDLTPLAQRVGAVNVFWHDQERLVGDNTDVAGARAILGAFDPHSVSAGILAVIGAGGSAAAVVAAAESCGFREVRIYNRSMAGARVLAARFPGFTTVCEDMKSAAHEAAVVVNATPVGMSTDDHPVPLMLLPPACAVFDLVYRPGETSWVRAARAAGHRAADGLGMLVEQGAAAFERWFGFQPDREVMWRAVQ